MKAIILLITFSVLTLIVLTGCSENKKETNKNAMGKKEYSKEKSTVNNKIISHEKKEQFFTELGDAPEAKSPVNYDFSKNPLECRIILLDDLITGNIRKLNKPMAKQLVENGKILAVKSREGNIYFVYNTDGSFASKQLANYTANNFIGIMGKAKQIHGVNIIIADMIESAD